MTDNYGIKVTRDGYDVSTATLQQLAFSSAYSIFKIIYSGTLSLSIGAGSGGYTTYSVSFDHNLGYIPAFYCYSYRETSSDRTMLDFASVFDGTFTHFVPVYARMTDSTLTVSADNTDAATKTITIYYFIFADAGE